MARTQEVRLTMRALKRKASEAEEPAATEVRQEAQVQQQNTMKTKAGSARGAHLGALDYVRMARALAKRRKNRVDRTRSREEKPNWAASLPAVPQSMPKIISRLEQDEREELDRLISGFAEVFARLAQRDKHKTEELGRLETRVSEMAADLLERRQSEELLFRQQSEAFSRLKMQNRRLKEMMNQGFSSRDETISELKEMMNEGFSCRDQKISELSDELAKEREEHFKQSQKKDHNILGLNDALDEEEEKSRQLEQQLKSAKVVLQCQERENEHLLAELKHQERKNEHLLADLKLFADMKLNRKNLTKS